MPGTAARRGSSGLLRALSEPQAVMAGRQAGGRRREEPVKKTTPRPRSRGVVVFRVKGYSMVKLCSSTGISSRL